MPRTDLWEGEEWSVWHGRDLEKRRREGTVLGFAIIRHIVELHGESVTLRSTPAVGTIVAFGLPIPATATTAKMAVIAA